MTKISETFRQATPAINASAAERLQRIAVQWTPAPAAVRIEPGGDERISDAPASIDGRRFQSIRLDGRSWRGLLIIVVGAAVFVGWMWLQGRPRAIAVAPELVAGQMTANGGGGLPGQPGSMSGLVVVDVIGAVEHPGIVRLPAGSRIDDAITAVGGAKSDKALASVNLARVLVDGEQIVVGVALGVAPGSSVDAAGVLSLNSASASELEALPGIGPVLASRIMAWRTTNGSFRSVDELGEVSGVGDSILEQLRPMVRV